ncbi:hypothetical protein CDCA_CDCA18G4516 [Cyanidium caldarium]|uniref:Large ribosomal subunit protein bL32m n=1 Tax=Cyanidium caldarium TaxID=2771 RepID=A0AAV9J289_CYACA|nr:hypothetical protein CDCA_CDCA18G4516 [Cyanidium caldarium]
MDLIRVCQWLWCCGSGWRASLGFVRPSGTTDGAPIRRLPGVVREWLGLWPSGSCLEATPHSLSPLAEWLWLATPKRRVSHSRKRLRSTHKYLRRVPNVQTCRSCGTTHMPHMLCPRCGAAPPKRWNRWVGLQQIVRVEGDRWPGAAPSA